MANLAEVSVENTGQHVLVFGPPKVGKTLAAGMLAREYRVILLDLENGFLTLKQLPPEYQRNIELIRIPDNKDNYLGIKTMLHLTDGKELKICDLHGTIGSMCVKCRTAEVKGNIVSFDPESLGPRDVIVMDSMSQLSDSAMGMAFKGQSIDDIKPEYSHYTAQGVYLNRVLTGIQQSQANWVVIAHEEIIDLTGKKGEKLVPRAGTRNFSKNFGKYFDHIVHMSIKSRKYSQNSDGTKDPSILTGSRTNVKLETGVTDGLIELLQGGTPVGLDVTSPAKEVESKVKVLSSGGKKVEATKVAKREPATIDSTATVEAATDEKPMSALERLRAKQKK